MKKHPTQIYNASLDPEIDLNLIKYKYFSQLVWRLCPKSKTKRKKKLGNVENKREKEHFKI